MIGLWDAPGDAEPALHFARRAWSTLQPDCTGSILT